MQRTILSDENALGQPSGNGVYERVKARVISHALPVGKRILIEPLADQLFVSSTPVREALIRLSAENVIQGVPKSGFFIKDMSETEFRDLYALQHLLLDWSVKSIRKDGDGPGMLKPPNLCAEIDDADHVAPDTTVKLMNTLFIHLARQTGNADIIRIVSNINDRTHFMREQDFTVFKKATTTALQLCQLYYAKEFDALCEGLKTHFHDKIARLPDLIRIIRSNLIKNSV